MSRSSDQRTGGSHGIDAGRRVAKPEDDCHDDLRRGRSLGCDTHEFKLLKNGRLAPGRFCALVS